MEQMIRNHCLIIARYLFFFIMMVQTIKRSLIAWSIIRLYTDNNLARVKTNVFVLYKDFEVLDILMKYLLPSSAPTGHLNLNWSVQKSVVLLSGAHSVWQNSYIMFAPLLMHIMWECPLVTLTNYVAKYIWIHNLAPRLFL